jgi:hypothetical protein
MTRVCVYLDCSLQSFFAASSLSQGASLGSVNPGVQLRGGAGRVLFLCLIYSIANSFISVEETCDGGSIQKLDSI